ncbi:hypothetical protein CHUAL_010755 [Chamberlinius hualienensis]
MQLLQRYGFEIATHWKAISNFCRACCPSVPLGLGISRPKLKEVEIGVHEKGLKEIIQSNVVDIAIEAQQPNGEEIQLPNDE